MIDPDVFAVEPWAVAERQMHLDRLAQGESIFALSNGHIGLRGNLDEGEPNAIPGTYLNGFFESLPLPYAEGGYGYPEEGQTLIDVTNGKVMRLLVDDEPFDVRYGTLQRHERVLDLRDGVLRREVEWTSPAGQAVFVRSTRLVSFVQRSIVAILYEVEPRAEPARIVVQSALVANEPVPAETDDPRAAAALRRAARSRIPHPSRPRSCARTPNASSGLRIAVGDGPRRRRTGRDRQRSRRRARPCPGDGEQRTRTRPAVAGRQVRGVRVVERSGPRPRYVIRSTPRSRREADRLERAAC